MLSRENNHGIVLITPNTWRHTVREIKLDIPLSLDQSRFLLYCLYALVSQFKSYGVIFCLKSHTTLGTVGKLWGIYRRMLEHKIFFYLVHNLLFISKPVHLPISVRAYVDKSYGWILTAIYVPKYQGFVCARVFMCPTQQYQLIQYFYNFHFLNQSQRYPSQQ